jgi:hypothetical protein
MHNPSLVPCSRDHLDFICADGPSVTIASMSDEIVRACCVAMKGVLRKPWFRGIATLFANRPAANHLIAAVKQWRRVNDW